MFIETLFTIAKTLKQPKCPPTEWMDKDVMYICIYIIYIYTHNRILLSYKNNEILLFETTQT